MHIFFGLLFSLFLPVFASTQKTFVSLEVFPSINTLTTLNCANTLAVYNGILSVSDTLLFQGNTLTIGNQNTPMRLSMPNLPLNQNQNQFLPCMISIGSNIVYLGDSTSPLPPLDFTSISSLETNDLLMYQAPNLQLNPQMNFNSIYPGDIFLGNNTIALNVMSPGSITFESPFSQKKLTAIRPYSIIFSCPSIEMLAIVSESVVTTNTILFHRPITVQGELINLAVETEIDNKTTTFGKMDLTSSININGAVLDSPHIILGTESKPITKITNIPLVDYVNGPPYLVLSEKDNITLYHTASVRMAEEVKKTYLKDNTLTIDAINTNSKEDIFLGSPIITIGKINIGNTLEINTNKAIGDFHFSDCSFSDDSLITIKGKATIKNKEEKKLTVEILHADQILLLSAIEIDTKNQNNAPTAGALLGIDSMGTLNEIITQNKNGYEEISRSIEKLKLKREKTKSIVRETKEKIKKVEKKIFVDKNILKKILSRLTERT